LYCYIITQGNLRYSKAHLRYIMSYIRSVSTLLRKVGNETITEIKVARSPLSKILSFFLNLASVGEFERRLSQTPYDKLYHLFMIVKTDRGTYLVEKNEVIIIKRFNGRLTKQTEVLQTNLREGLTLNILLEKTRKNIGDKFYTYKGQDNNCQFFINSILKSNGLNTDELEKFVMQDTRYLFDNNPRFRKIVNSITDIGAVSTTVIDEIKEQIEDPANKETLLDKASNLFTHPLFNATESIPLLGKQLLKVGFQNSLLGPQGE
jgi:hypothetical protein